MHIVEAILGETSPKVQFSKKLTKIKNIPEIKPNLVMEIMKYKTSDLKQENAFFVCDLASIHQQFTRWINNLPTFSPFYAIKCNPDPMVLRLLAKLGAGFDCASKGEIQTILNLDVDPSRIIYANPCKPISHIKFAASNGVRLMTFDNADELAKIKQCYPKAQLVLRILADDSKSVCRFGVKFGAHLDVVESLIKEAKHLNLEIVGVSFHVGSGCYDPSSYDDAIKRAKCVFDIAKDYGYNMKVLDIGGGFPSSLSLITSEVDGKQIIFENIAKLVNKAVETYFPNWEKDGMAFIGEPGRYFVSGAFTLATTVTSRRTIVGKESTLTPLKTDNTYMYYINDGVYGSFNCLIYDHAIVCPNILKSLNTSNETYESSLWGPTCDSMDLILKSTQLPKLEINDWLYFKDMGAYTVCAASQFNGFKKPFITYTDTSVGQIVKNLFARS